MRNGLNTGNMSEFVNEIRTNPKEAAFIYGCRADFAADGHVEVTLETLRGGSLRIARAFKFLVSDGAPGARQFPGPYEYLLTALGGCVIVTFVLGCSARGITLNDLEIRLRARVDRRRSSPLDQLHYEIAVNCASEDVVLRELAEYVSCLSPNHRTFIDHNSYDLDVSVVDEGGQVSHREKVSPQPGGWVPDPSVGEAASEVVTRLAWKYGTQMEGRVSMSDGATLAGVVNVDQPKQALGLDFAPNPQEYLLGVLGAEYLHVLGSLARQRGVTLRRASTTLVGKLDLRGLMNVDSSVPVRVHEIGQKVEIDSPQPFDEVRELAAQAAGICISQQTVCKEGGISVAISNAGRLVAEFKSDKAFTSACLRRLAEAGAAHS